MSKYALLRVKEMMDILSLKTNDIHSIINQDDRDIINRRIINNLIHLSINNTNNNNLNFLEELGIPNDNNELAKNINNYSKIELAINNDISLLFISILNEISLLKINLSYKKKLTKSLYNTLYITILVDFSLYVIFEFKPVPFTILELL